VYFKDKKRKISITAALKVWHKITQTHARRHTHTHTQGRSTDTDTRPTAHVTEVKVHQNNT